MIGGDLLGVVGMVIGVPTFAVLYSLTSDLLARRLKAKGIDKNGDPLPQAPVPAEEQAAAENNAGPVRP